MLREDILQEFCMLLFAITSIRFPYVQSKIMKTSEAQQIIKRLFKDGAHMSKAIPAYPGHPVKVYFSITLNDMVPLDFFYNHIFAEVIVHQDWTDERLQFNSSVPNATLILAGDDVDTVWLPDLWITNERGKPYERFPKTEASLQIRADGHVYYSVRFSINVFCPMNYTNFPFDRQACDLPIESYGYNTDMLELLPSKTEDILNFREDFKIKEFIMNTNKKGYHVQMSRMDYGITGHFDRILIRLFLRRDIYFYLMEYYVPLALVVSSSWISFWIDYRCTPARATLPVTTFLTLNSMAENLRARDAGSQSYSTALEIYINACSFYVFAALIEYAIVGITDHMWHKEGSSVIDKDSYRVELPFLWSLANSLAVLQQKTSYVHEDRADAFFKEKKDARSKGKAYRQRYLRAAITGPVGSRRFDDIAEEESSKETENHGWDPNSIDFLDKRENEDFTGISKSIKYNEDETRVLEGQSKCKEPKQENKRNKKKRNKAINLLEKRKARQGKVRSRRSGLGSIELKNIGMEESGIRNRGIWNHGVGSRGVENCGTESSTSAKSNTESSTEESTGIRSSTVEMIAIKNVGIEDPGIRNPCLHSKESGNNGTRSLGEMSCVVEECRENDWEFQVETEAQVLREISRNHIVSGIDIENITVENVDIDKFRYENEGLQDHRNTDLDLNDYLPGAVEIKVEQNVDEDESDCNRIDNIDIVNSDMKDDVSSKNEFNRKRIPPKDAEQRSTDNDTGEANNKRRRFGCFPVKNSCVKKKRKEGHVIDKYSRALFPSTFIIFNAVYAAFCIWGHLLTES